MLNDNIVKFEIDENFHKFTRKKKIFFEKDFVLKRKSSIKDIIESFGIPHTEIGNLIKNNKELNFEYIPVKGDHIQIKSITYSINVKLKTKLRPLKFDDIKFIADVNIGKAAILLRALGFDTLWEDRLDDGTIAKISEDQKRIVLTRDIDLLKRKSIAHGMFVDSMQPFEQIKLILERFGLNPPYDLFSRCTRCNCILESIEKEKIIDRLLPKTKLYYDSFFICPGCKKIYWEGSHREKIINDFKKNGIQI
ncbi:MAG: Mut7-C RNAse domain-containing protein [Desulforegulaceae bacterium]|nr:Mut7-C RNAse domain-containing protein [Desulforegulaceae bacterium]